MQADIDTLMVCSCDQRYFPLAKGLILSIVEQGTLPAGVGLGFVDIGCEPEALQWLRQHGARIRMMDPLVLGGLAAPELGYQRSQTCRPLLPKMFPEVSRLIWLDCDAWIQDMSILAYLREALARNREQLFIAPECHYTYTTINEDSERRQNEMYGYYEQSFGTEVAVKMSRRVTLNSGFFAMAAENPLWAEWETEVRRIFLGSRTGGNGIARHMAEQLALNVAATRSPNVTLLDPLYNYVCLWNPPFRDADGVVRVALPPHAAVGIVHLAGGWRLFGERYRDRGLLYRSGGYLTDADRRGLFCDRGPAEVR